MSPCDYINLGYHGLLITMVSFSKFITSQRGGQILVDPDGYLYTLKHKQKTRNTHLCRSHGRKKKSGESATDPQPCPAKLFFYSESEIHLETGHNHEPKAGEPEALDTKTGIKRKAEEQPRSKAVEGTNFPVDSRGVKRQNGNKSLPYKTYFPKGLTQNNHGFQCSLAQIKNRYPLSGLFARKWSKLFTDG